ncbi:MAG TPA: DUF2231 domain-containing protein [Opitutaceae bacterium]
MKLVDILQGKWLGHPLHPALVHLPIGLWTAAAVLDVAAWFAPAADVLARLGFAAVALGLLTAVLAVPTGVADWAPVKKEKPAWKLGLYHMLLNLLAMIVWAANAGLRLGTLEPGAAVTLPILLTSLTGALLVFASGYLGCRMVFEHGVSIARQSKKKWRAEAERGGSRLPDAG